TCIIVALLHGQTIEAWQEKIKERVAAQEGYPTPDELPAFFSPEAQHEARLHWENVRQQERTGGVSTPGTGPLRQLQLAGALGKEGMFT
ncbi:hypothetical protein EXIGLDRAFT_777565, partial [Exidia glandulosa HHB12029]